MTTSSIQEARSGASAETPRFATLTAVVSAVSLFALVQSGRSGAASIEAARVMIARAR